MNTVSVVTAAKKGVVVSSMVELCEVPGKTAPLL